MVHRSSYTPTSRGDCGDVKDRIYAVLGPRAPTCIRLACQASLHGSCGTRYHFKHSDQAWAARAAHCFLGVFTSTLILADKTIETVLFKYVRI